jgi:hypothetical protein
MHYPILVTKDYDVYLSEAEDIYYGEKEICINYRGERDADNTIYLKESPVENISDEIRKKIHAAMKSGDIFVDIRGYEK